MNSVKDKVILVTGGGQGLGAAICKTLAADGATVIPVDIKEEGTRKVMEEIGKAGGKAASYKMDVGNVQEIDEVIQKVISEHGKLDYVINNAGIDYTKSVEELSHEEWNRVMEVNLTGPFNVSKAVFPILKENGHGHIVNIVSTAAKRTWANASAYHASKWGLLGFTHALHVEGRQENIKVTAVIAGGMQTPFILERFPDTDPNVLQKPENVADTVKYVLCQPQDSVIPEVMVIPMRETSWP
ncbi:NADP-dependent 3-hydroxy acid dehydrogenase YdfG [Pontibacter ummariensis]|uniref:NADP-dependent 3-hydroxy acid dehydrogenase YdfG n=1 Tax=Pontibacter ummariensis TaxID=1610492 RepID=A0A239FG73_9BACT|nr:SDR family oxidoreductase [Pontibacter ummariensis]PRY12282.1 NADP-dependent 3-hydroxy acid dehydrogenase YdfG [Pontibacter ummariensis]SNS55528.1 NADP-dependent 3-hydroxy acid dehydrogenase YdfG [Pontibacter ummariensis]